VAAAEVVYDDRGSELFEQITRLPEYYPHPAERSILVERAGEIAAVSHADTPSSWARARPRDPAAARCVARLGALRRFVPVDVSEGALRAAATAILTDYPG